MSMIDVETLRNRADELVAKAISGEPTVIEQNGRRAILLACEGDSFDFESNASLDRLLRQRISEDGAEPRADDWARLRASLHAK